MWIFTKNGFISAVVNNDAPNSILVRARKEADLRAFVGHTHSKLKLAEKILHTPNADYAWRVAMPRGQFERAVSGEAEQVDYPNFKAAVGLTYPDPRLSRILSNTWHDLRAWQEQD
jgi:hypothetical protein